MAGPKTQRQVCFWYGADMQATTSFHSGTCTTGELLVNFEAATDIGLKRSQNQDSFCTVGALCLFAVADGMGGHQGGEIASTMAITLVTEYIQNHQESEMKKNIIDAFLHTNRVIYEKSRETPELQGMGTTMTLALIRGRQLIIGHVGDSRCYLFKPPLYWQLTRDHSLVQERVHAGLMTRAEAKTDSRKNVLSRSVGFEPHVIIDTYEYKLSPGDRILLCSDGLSGPVDDAAMNKIIQTQEHSTPALIQAAYEGGGGDNISCIVLRIESI